MKSISKKSTRIINTDRHAELRRKRLERHAIIALANDGEAFIPRQAAARRHTEQSAPISCHHHTDK